MYGSVNVGGFLSNTKLRILSIFTNYKCGCL